MALIQCGECGKEVSDKAASCPGCGAPVASPADNKTSRQKASDRYKDHSVKEILMRDRNSIEGEIDGAKLVEYLPVVVMIILVGFYLPLRYAREMGVGYEQYAFISVGAMVLGVVFRKRLNGWVGWIAAVILILAVIFSPEVIFSP